MIGLRRHPRPTRAVARLPAAADLPAGAMLQVIGARLWVDAGAAGWRPIADLPAGPLWPSPVGLPNGAMLQVIAALWHVETAAGWRPTTAQPPAAAAPDATSGADGSMPQVINNRWIFL